MNSDLRSLLRCSRSSSHQQISRFSGTTVICVFIDNWPNRTTRWIRDELCRPSQEEWIVTAKAQILAGAHFVRSVGLLQWWFDSINQAVPSIQKCYKYCRQSLIRFSFSKQWFYISHTLAMFLSNESMFDYSQINTQPTVSNKFCFPSHSIKKRSLKALLSELKCFWIFFSTYSLAFITKMDLFLTACQGRYA